MSKPNYWYDDQMPDLVMVDIHFKDTEGENVGRWESFVFEKADFTDEVHERLEKKYDVEIHPLNPRTPIHSTDYILSVYDKELD